MQAYMLAGRRASNAAWKAARTGAGRCAFCPDGKLVDGDRSGDKILDGTAVNLSASIIRSGAGEVLLPWRSLTM